MINKYAYLNKLTKTWRKYHANDYTEQLFIHMLGISIIIFTFKVTYTHTLTEWLLFPLKKGMEGLSLTHRFISMSSDFSVKVIADDQE